MWEDPDRMRNFSENISTETAVLVPKEWMFGIRTDCKVGSRPGPPSGLPIFTDFLVGL